MKAIHQLVAGFSKGDAISNEALQMRTIFRNWGFTSEIYSETSRILPELRKTVRDVSVCRESLSPDDLVILHLSIGSMVNMLFKELNCKKALLYHNITPPEQLKVLQPQSARNAELGLQQARMLTQTAQINMADSQFNADELVNFGFNDVKILPLILDFNELNRKTDRKTVRKYSDGLKNILFVGRCVPNKRIEDLIAAFYYYQSFTQPDSRFIHVGSFTGTESYHAFLLTLVHENGIRNTLMPGSVSQPELNAYFELADLFVCMSEHEGFCIPLLEAMHRGIPVMAYDAGAVAETMDGAGILFKEKEFDQLGEMMGRITADDTFRKQIIDGQNARVQRYQARNLEQELRDHLSVFF